MGLLAVPQALRAAPMKRRPELRIRRIVVQDARGRRLTPVAPNAYAPYRGYDVAEPVLRIQFVDGEDNLGGIRQKSRVERYVGPKGQEPLFVLEG